MKELKINPIFVSEAAKVISRAAELEENHIFNIGGIKILSLKQIGEIIGRSCNKEPVFDVHPDEKPNNVIGDITKMSQIL